MLWKYHLLFFAIWFVLVRFCALCLFCCKSEDLLDWYVIWGNLHLNSGYKKKKKTLTTNLYRFPSFLSFLFFFFSPFPPWIFVEHGWEVQDFFFFLDLYSQKHTECGSYLTTPKWEGLQSQINDSRLSWEYWHPYKQSYSLIGQVIFLLSIICFK